MMTTHTTFKKPHLKFAAKRGFFGQAMAILALVFTLLPSAHAEVILGEEAVVSRYSARSGTTGISTEFETKDEAVEHVCATINYANHPPLTDPVCPSRPVPDYDPERHFGSVYFSFLTWGWLPDERRIEIIRRVPTTVYNCPETHPIKLDTDGDEVFESCQSYECECDEDLTENGQCVARELEWEEPVALDDQGTYLQTTTPNNEGRQCGFVIEPESCADEKPIQNLDEVGNPISCADGQKVQAEQDYQSPVGNLRYARTYLNDPRSGNEGFSIVQQEAIPGNVQILTVRAEIDSDAWLINIPKLLDYGYGYLSVDGGTGSRRLFHNFTPFRERDGSLVFENGTYTHRSITGTEYEFDAERLITKKTFRNGQYQLYTRPAEGELVITDNFGRQMALTISSGGPFGAGGGVTSMTDPAGHVTRYEYNNDSVLTKVIYPDTTPGDGDNPFKTYTYESVGSSTNALIGMDDELGVAYAEWAYDEHERGILSKHHGDAEKVTVEYLENDATTGDIVSRVTHHREAGQTVQTMYYFKTLNGAHKPTRIQQLPCAGCTPNEVLYSYDAQGYLSQITRSNGEISKYQYNSRGLLESRTQAFGDVTQRATTTIWHANYNLPLSIEDPKRSSTFTYDANGNRLTSTVVDRASGASRTLTYTYNTVGQVLTIDGPRTDVTDITTFEYAANGNLTKVTNALGHISQITGHDAHGKPTTVIDANGTLTTMSYHPRGWLNSMTVNGDTTNYSYDKAGQLTRVTSPNGTELNYAYDTAHRVKTISDALGNSIDYTLDLQGNRTRTDLKDPNGVVKSYVRQAYNNLGQLVQSLGASDQSNSWSYDSQGNTSNSTDALGHTSNQTFDKLNRVISALDPESGESSYHYDSDDQLTKVTDARGMETHYVYNGYGELTSLISPDTGTQTFSYDQAGNQLTATDARGITLSYAYDALNRPISVTYPDPAENVSFSYDDTANGNKGIGRLTQTTDETGTTSYSYDAKGQLIEETRTLGSNQTAYSTGYSYDAGGLVTQVRYPSGRLLNISRNALGQVSQLTTQQSGASPVQTLASNVNYLPFGPISNLTYGNGKQLSNSYDADYRLTSKTVTGVTNLAYGYTARNNINAITDAIDVNQNQSFAYDSLMRLTQADGDYGSQTYTFDSIGNRTSVTKDGQTESYQYGTTSHQLEGITNASGTKALTFDVIGNTLTKGDTTFTYNQAGRLNTATRTGNSATVMSASYQVNSSGQRVSKTVDGVTTIFHYDQAGQLIAETDDQGAVTKEYIYLDGMRLATIDGSQLYYVHTNHLDTPIALTDQAGVIQWQASYDPYGNAQILVNNVNEKARMPGQYYDDETGLHYNYFRDYDPEIGRYIQSDPIGLSDGPSTYGYVHANPVNSYDPNGLATPAKCLNPINAAVCAAAGIRVGGAATATVYVAAKHGPPLVDAIVRMCQIEDDPDDSLEQVDQVPQHTMPVSAPMPMPPSGGPDDEDEYLDGDASNSPISIPRNAKRTVQQKDGYTQVRYRWNSNGHRFEARWHTETPGAPTGSGPSWVVSRTTPGTPFGQQRATHILTRANANTNRWVPRSEWQRAIQARQGGTATRTQSELLKSGHFR